MNNKSWDDLAADYDKSVEDNQSPLVINYLKEEIEILKNLFLKIHYEVYFFGLHILASNQNFQYPKNQ